MQVDGAGAWLREAGSSSDTAFPERLCRGDGRCGPVRRRRRIRRAPRGVAIVRGGGVVGPGLNRIAPELGRSPSPGRARSQAASNSVAGRARNVGSWHPARTSDRGRASKSGASRPADPLPGSARDTARPRPRGVIPTPGRGGPSIGLGRPDREPGSRRPARAPDRGPVQGPEERPTAWAVQSGEPRPQSAPLPADRQRSNPSSTSSPSRAQRLRSKVVPYEWMGRDSLEFQRTGPGDR
jgi:hypothetical protein